jgi:hypothetical protein
MRNLAGVRLFIAVLLIAGMAQAAQAGDWPMFRHDLTHSGASNEILNPLLEIKWKFQTGKGISSSPAISNGIVYVGSLDGYIYAIDAELGYLIWKIYIGQITSSPLVFGDLVYVGSDDKYLYALDALTGTLKWRYQTSGKVISSPSFSGGNLYVGSEDGYLYAFSSSNITEETQILEIPRLISPLNGDNMSNWHNSGSVWDFDWSDVEDASEYQLYVKEDLAEYPIIDTICTNSFHQYVHTGTVNSRNYYGWRSTH